jgi:hypothetical protein
VILAVLDVSIGGLTGAKSLYFAVDEIDAVQARAASLDVLAPYTVHGEPAGEVRLRPWHERSRIPGGGRWLPHRHGRIISRTGVPAKRQFPAL